MSMGFNSGWNIFEPETETETLHKQVAFLNRKEGNDQESIQLPNTFRSKTPKGKKEALKATAPQLKHYKQKAKRAVSIPKIS